MRKAAVALLLLLALSAAAAQKGKLRFVLDCDPEESDCDAVNPKKEKNIEHIEVDVPEGRSPEHRGDIIKVRTPKFDPNPVEVPKERKVKDKWDEAKLKDTTEKREADFRKIRLPTFEARPVEEPKERKRKEKWDEAKLKDTSEKREDDFRKIRLPMFNPKPVPVEEKPIEKKKWHEEPVLDVTENPKRIYEQDKEDNKNNADGMKNYRRIAKREAQDISKANKQGLEEEDSE